MGTLKLRPLVHFLGAVISPVPVATDSAGRLAGMGPPQPSMSAPPGDDGRCTVPPCPPPLDDGRSSLRPGLKAQSAGTVTYEYD